MGITKTIGKNTLGDGKKMTVSMRAYHRSTHNLSYAWRSTMGVGVLVPCMKLIALRGDTFDIDIDAKVLTHPTVGPLFGSYKLQIDIFSCPIRLYQAMLHNNALNVGLDMSKVKLPKISIELVNVDNPTSDNQWSQIHPSSVLAYLGQRGWGYKEDQNGPAKVVKKSALGILSYIDSFKNYYANKQEENYYAILPNGEQHELRNYEVEYGLNETWIKGYFTIEGTVGHTFTETEAKLYTYKSKLNNGNIIKYTYNDLKNNGFTFSASNTTNNARFTRTSAGQIKGRFYEAEGDNYQILSEFKLKELDDLRENILRKNREEVIITKSNGEGSEYLKKLLGRSAKEGTFNTKKASSGLLLKTHQSDIFNNWVNTEWIDGDNGINKITAIDTSKGSFELDTLNLAQKVYNMLNRIATSGGTYQDWLDVVYTDGKNWHTETPMYEGGYSSEIQFEEVVSNSATAEQPLGTLAGRGISVGKKGGKLHIKVDEHSIILGIVSITPHVDYSQGNDWDIDIDTMNDFRKPALDGIGFQDLTLNKMAWWKPNTIAIGKQPAWIDYMTNFNKTYGNFVAGGNEAFMCLNRIYEPENGDYKNGKLNSTTYINPEDYNYIFAENNLESQNFWVQIGFGIKARRVGGAKQIPNL